MAPARLDAACADRRELLFHGRDHRCSLVCSEVGKDELLHTAPDGLSRLVQGSSPWGMLRSSETKSGRLRVNTPSLVLAWATGTFRPNEVLGKGAEIGEKSLKAVHGQVAVSSLRRVLPSRSAGATLD